MCFTLIILVRETLVRQRVDRSGTSALQENNVNITHSIINSTVLYSVITARMVRLVSFIRAKRQAFFLEIICEDQSHFSVLNRHYCRGMMYSTRVQEYLFSFSASHNVMNSFLCANAVSKI